ncbi:MAG TPA: DUF6624 domain-containing protein [Ohtaekwangia sp.]|uniref:DUF6624 domain-containing protein n=1 Tax=Ohtaekwangia sp. TaxID=2066019 RepID=UPI002F93B37C
MFRLLVLIPVYVLACTTTVAQTYDVLIAKGDSAYQAKSYEVSARYYGQAFRQRKNNATHLYNGACSAALSGHTTEAFQYLNAAIDNGWLNINHLKSDTDLKSLYTNAQWNKTVAKLQKKVDETESHYNKPLQQELLKILEEDQAQRSVFMQLINTHGYKNPKVDSVSKIIHRIDSINQIKVIAILDKYGWVGKDKIGSSANEALFLVIQHSNIAVQQKYLPMMRDAVKKGNAEARSLALLEDRVALRTGGKQIYGSQIGLNEETGKYYISPLQDPDNVDKRRASMGLPPLADYAQSWGIVWNVEEYKKSAK